jgi:hypothetical protein
MFHCMDICILFAPSSFTHSWIFLVLDYSKCRYYKHFYKRFCARIGFNTLWTGKGMSCNSSSFILLNTASMIFSVCNIWSATSYNLCTSSSNLDIIFYFTTAISVSVRWQWILFVHSWFPVILSIASCT